MIINQKSIWKAGVIALMVFSFFRPAEANVEEGAIYDFQVETIDGESRTLEEYKGKVLLIVNTASRCGFTPQYASLQTLYEKYQDRGFEVLAFPANNFMNQEPGTNTEIKNFCYMKYKTTFPLFGKISVKGEDISPLYEFLTSYPGHSGPITWNFNKFLISKSGKVLSRFGSRVDPLSPKIIDQLETALSE